MTRANKQKLRNLAASGLTPKQCAAALSETTPHVLAVAADWGIPFKTKDKITRNAFGKVKRSSWSEEHLAMIMEQRKTDEDIANLIGRTVPAIRNKRLLIRRRDAVNRQEHRQNTGRGMRWTEEEEQLIIDGLSFREISMRIKRSVRSIEKRRQYLVRTGRCEARQKGGYSTEEIQMLTDMEHSYAELSKITGRSVQALRNRRYELVSRGER